MTRVAAVLETSFWVAGYRAEICANLLDLFDLIPPSAVEEEIFENDPRFPQSEFPYTTLFRHLRSHMTNPPSPEPTAVASLGKGEAAAIALAQHLHAPLLINERRGVAFARALGLVTVSVPSVVVAIYERGVISDRAACRKLQLIEGITPPTFIRDAKAALAALGAVCP